MEKVEILLPAEVAKIAESVSVEKRNEVQEVLNKVFSGVEKMKKQIETIEVTNHQDKASMQLARVARLAVRAERLAAEKEFDSKREDVQIKMLSFKTEDSLWLKAKQTMQILTKELEEVAKWKEETKERYDAEQRELKIQERIISVQKFNSNIQRGEFENMSDETFNSFVSGLEAAHIAKIEAERKADEERKEAERKEAERIETQSLENERLKKEAEAKELELKAEREKAEADRKKAEAEAERIRKESEAKLLAERKAAQEKLDKKMAESKKLAQELEASKKFELQKKIDKEIAEEKARKEAEELTKAPIKKQLENWVEGFEISVAPIMNDTSKEIQAKFASFKKWAILEISKL